MKKFLIIGVVLLLISCYKKPEPKHFPNQPPETYISNIMIADSLGDTAVADTSNLPYDSIYVYGYDGDGRIIAFQWAIDDTMLDTTIYESGWHWDSIGWADGEKAVITFPATQLDTFYEHIFYVRAVDNDSLVDPTPAILKLFVKNNYLPHPAITPWIYEGGMYWAQSPDSIQYLYILYDPEGDTGLDTTSYWKGISLTWTAIDSDAVSPLMFSYRWDNDTFSTWTYDTTKMFITGRKDTTDTTGRGNPILLQDGLHRFQLIARDDAFAVSPETATVYIRTYKKTFNNKVLLVDATPTILVTPFDTIHDAEMDSFYHVLMDTVTYDDWDNSDGTNPITMDLLAPYSTVVFYMDFPASPKLFFKQASKSIFKFLSSGGNLIVMGSQVYSQGIDVSTEKDSIYKKYYFGVRAYEPDTAKDSTAKDFIGALSIYNATAYPEMEYDSLKYYNPFNPGGYQPGMKNVGIFYKLTAHSEGIYGFDSYYRKPYFQGKPCAVQNESPDGGFRVVFFDFPWYFMKTDAEGEPLKTAMQSAIKYVRGESQ